MNDYVSDYTGNANKIIFSEELPMLDHLEKEHQQVSIEMSNLFLEAGSFAKNRLSKFMRSSTDTAIQLVHAISRNQSGRDTGVITPGAVQQLTSKFSYSDIARVEVFVPSVLKPKVTMDVYGASLLKSIEIAYDIVDFGGQEVLDNVEKYISLPNRLGDITGDESVGDITSGLMHRLTNAQKEFAELTVSNGTQTQRPYSEAFRRNLDYVKAVEHCNEIEKKLNAIINKLPAYTKLMDKTSAATKRLASLIETKPDQYRLGNVAGARLSNLVFTLAKETEYVGAVIHFARTYIKSMADTHAVIVTATKRFTE
jgi:hypothetical protein